MIDHTPCRTLDQRITRNIMEQNIIESMKIQGFPIKEWAVVHEEGTNEHHVMPVFQKDTIEDICNRYADYFPRTLKAIIDIVEGENQTLYSGTGMSKGKTMMASGKVPAGLQVLLDIWCDGDFLGIKDNQNRLFKHMPKLKIGNSFGKTHFGYERSDA